MDTLFHLLGYLIPFLLVLTVLVFVHELGHYLVARYNGVKVEVFSIGFGPELLGWNDKRGTRWKISLLPLGGYVKMFGDADASSKPDMEKLGSLSQDLKDHSLFYKTVWQRIAVTAAGPLANYLFAIVIFAGVFMTVGERYTVPVLGNVLHESAAASAGLKTGDRVLKLQGNPVNRFEEIVDIVRENPGTSLAFEVQREKETLQLSVMPETIHFQDRFGYTHRIGRLGVSSSGQVEFISQNPLMAVGKAIGEVFVISWKTLEAVGQMLTGMRSGDEIGGVLRIAKMSGEVASLGIPTFFWFMGLLSINLGLINLFPIPMLDGGHLLFYGIEAVRGKPLSEKAQEWGFRFGLLCVLSLVVFSTWNDLSQLKVFHFFVGLFE
ncbi:MAG: RIP metalloprotease RseP [Alphaproteobacteria bacterium]